MEQDKIKAIVTKYSKKYEVVNLDLIMPNTWNPNVQSEQTFGSVKKSIEKYGWLVEPLVRYYTGLYQIIDGEHRIKAARELGLKEVKLAVLGDEQTPVSDEDAMVLTQLLNTRGQDDVLKRAALLKRLKDSKQGDLFGMLDMTEKQIESELKLLDFDFKQFENVDLNEDDTDNSKKVLLVVQSLERELRKLHALTSNTSFKLLIEQGFEWIKTFLDNIK